MNPNSFRVANPYFADVRRKFDAGIPPTLRFFHLVEIGGQNGARLTLPKFLSLSDYATLIEDETVGVTVGTDRHFSGDDRLTASTNFIF